MTPNQKSGRARTGDILGESGIWLIRCTREGCCSVERLSLRQGQPAPPCRKCLNVAWLRFVRADIPTELPAEPAPPPAARIDAPCPTVSDGIRISWTPNPPVPFAIVGGLEDLREIAKSRRPTTVILPAAPEETAPDNPADKKAPAADEAKP